MERKHEPPVGAPPPPKRSRNSGSSSSSPRFRPPLSSAEVAAAALARAAADAEAVASAPSSGRSFLMEIPMDVFRAILLFVPILEAVQHLSVCKAWRAALCHRAALPGSLRACGIRGLFASFERYNLYRFLQASGVQWTDARVVDVVGHAFPGITSRVSTLRYSCLDTVVCAPILRAFHSIDLTGVRELRVDFCGVPPNAFHVETFAGVLPNITTLRIDGMNRVNTDAVLRLLQVSPKVRTLHLTVCDGIDSSAWCAHIAARPGGYDRVSVHIESYAVPNLLTALRTWEALKDRVVFMVTVSVVGVSFTEDAKGWPQAARIMDRLEIREMHLSNTLNPAVFGNHTAQTLEVFRWGGVMCSCNSDIRAFLRLFRDGTLRMRRYRDSREILQ